MQLPGSTYPPDIVIISGMIASFQFSLERETTKDYHPDDTPTKVKVTTVPFDDFCL